MVKKFLKCIVYGMTAIGLTLGSFIAIFFAIGSILFIYSLSDTLANSKRLDQLEQAFLTVQPPESTTFIKREKDRGLLDGNGNHCDYFVGELRTYHDSKQHICQFYRNITLQIPAYEGYNIRVRVDFLQSSAFSGSVFEAWMDIVRNTPEAEVFEWCSSVEVEQGAYRNL